MIRVRQLKEQKTCLEHVANRNGRQLTALVRKQEDEIAALHAESASRRRSRRSTRGAADPV